MTIQIGGYQGARSCTGGPTQGARNLMSWWLGAYGNRGARNLGIYNCRPVSGGSVLSLHAEGRAADLGTPVGNTWSWGVMDTLRLNSYELGLQCVIHNRSIWSSIAPDWRPYSGSSPHLDHGHVELLWWAANGGLTVDLLNQVMGGGTPPPPPPPPMPVLRLGSQGDVVRRLQETLNRWYPSLPPLVVDGDFGPRTDARVRYFQQRAGLMADGIVGPATWRALGF